jgi:hypothetical protein
VLTPLQMRRRCSTAVRPMPGYWPVQANTPTQHSGSRSISGRSGGIDGLIRRHRAKPATTAALNIQKSEAASVAVIYAGE